MGKSLVNPDLKVGVMYPAGTLLGEEGTLMVSGGSYTYNNGTHVHFMLSKDGTDSCASAIDPSPYVGVNLNATNGSSAYYGEPLLQLYGLSGARPVVDLAFVIDTTGSMGPYITSVQTAAVAILGKVLTDADAEVAVVDYKDYYSGCASDGYAARVDQDFTSDSAALTGAIMALTAYGGCDTPESVYSGLLTALNLKWPQWPGVQKSIILMGDAPPHDPEPVTGYTLSSVVDAAKAVDPASVYTVAVTPTSASSRPTREASIARCQARMTSSTAS
jgi:hypothetical protein